MENKFNFTIFDEEDEFLGFVSLPGIPQIGSYISKHDGMKVYKITSIEYMCKEKEKSPDEKECVEIALIVR